MARPKGSGVTPPAVRFWSMVERTPTCWLWNGCIRSNGYGQFHDGTKVVKVHRFAYKLLVGPIPDGLQLDHLCRVRHCVNPAHLEPVTQIENIRRGESLPTRNGRKTHCANGHPFDEKNTYVDKNGWRGCKECGLAWKREPRISKVCLWCGVAFATSQHRTRFCSKSCGSKHYRSTQPLSQSPAAVEKRTWRERKAMKEAS